MFILQCHTKLYHLFLLIFANSLYVGVSLSLSEVLLDRMVTFEAMYEKIQLIKEFFCEMSMDINCDNQEFKYSCCVQLLSTVVLAQISANVDQNNFKT